MSEKKQTKKALIMSVTSMVLCVAMLVGMTFAWFTDTASTSVNKIQSGNLEVDIVAATTGTSIQGTGLQFVSADGKTGTGCYILDRWIPSCEQRKLGIEVQT